MSVKPVIGIMVRNRTIFIFLSLVGLIVYRNSLTVPFHFDDIQYLKESILIKSFDSLRDAFISGPSAFFGGRPILLLTFFLNYQLGGLDVFGYHLINVFLHIVNAFLLYVLFSRYAEPEQEKGHSWKYIVAALLFLVHPVNTESVTYLSSRSSVLSLFFVLLSMLCFFRSTGRGFHAGYYAAGIVSFLLGLASKQTAIILIPLLLLFDYFFGAQKGKAFFTRLKYHLPYVLIAALLTLVYLPSLTAPEAPRPWPEHVLTELRVFMRYGKLLLVPSGLNIDHDIQPSRFADGSAAASAAGIAALIGIAVIARKKAPGISFAVFWYFISLAPFLAIRLNDFMAERWAYPASIGFSIGMAELAMMGAGYYRKTAIAAAGACIVLFGVGTVMRNDVYASPMRLWEDAVKKSPEKPRPYLNLSRAYLENGNPAQAIQCIKTALRLGEDRGLRKKEVVAAHVNLAAAYGNDPEKAEEALKGIEKSAGHYHEYYHSLGLIRMMIGNYDQAIAALQKALELRPGSPTLLNQIGNGFERLHQDKKAREYYLLAVKGTPQSGVDYANQGEAYHRLGEPDKRLTSYYKAVQVDPFDLAIRLDLAAILLDAGSVNEAWLHYERAAQISTYSPHPYRGMGLVMLAKGRTADAILYFETALELLAPDSPERKGIQELREGAQQKLREQMRL